MGFKMYEETNEAIEKMYECMMELEEELPKKVQAKLPRMAQYRGMSLCEIGKEIQGVDWLESQIDK
jgi:hypothetical protein